AGENQLPDELVDRIVERADGIPLFAEELTKSLLESSATPRSTHGPAVKESHVLPIPSTLHTLLMERLDRIGSHRASAEIAAAIGREFSHELLEAVADRTTNQVQEALEKLVSVGLIVRRGAAMQTSYLFKHALVQDAAYATLLRSQRIQIHA